MIWNKFNELSSSRESRHYFEIVARVWPSNSVWPHRWQPTRLPHPWDSPSKNTGVGCHFLLQCIKVKSESEVAQSCPTLCDPMDRSLPGFSVHRIFQARVLEWVATYFTRRSSQSRDQMVSRISGRRFYHLSHQGSKQRTNAYGNIT